jgi:phosphoheptose isomerase
VKAVEAISGVGLLIKPEAGTELWTLEGKCVQTEAISGDIAGEVTPVGTSGNDGKIIFTATSAGVQKIKTINLLGKAENQN